jgi:hypothetical protein
MVSARAAEVDRGAEPLRDPVTAMPAITATARIAAAAGQRLTYASSWCQTIP